MPSYVIQYKRVYNKLKPNRIKIRKVDFKENICQRKVELFPKLRKAV